MNVGALSSLEPIVSGANGGVGSTALDEGDEHCRSETIQGSEITLSPPCTEPASEG